MVRRPPQAGTAFGPMVIVAVERLRPEPPRILDDDLAGRLLPAGMRLSVAACRWGALRDLLVRMADSRAAGIWAEMLCRKRYGDDQVRAALDAGMDRFVFLGAGLDTRACRLVAPTGATAVEADLPANVTLKRDRLRAVLGPVPERVALCSVDLEHEEVGPALAATGFDPHRPTMFVWEAVTQYLTEEGVTATLAFLAGAASGSRLIFTYVLRDFLTGADLGGGERMHRDFAGPGGIWRWGLNPDEVGPLLAGYGWEEREQVGPAEYRERYLVPSGREMAVSGIERFVLAVRS